METRSSVLPMARGAWWATVPTFTKSRTRLSHCTRLFLQVSLLLLTAPGTLNGSQMLRKTRNFAVSYSVLNSRQTPEGP